MEKKPVVGDIWKYGTGADDTSASYWFVYHIKNETMYINRLGTIREFKTEYSFKLMESARHNWSFIQGSK